MRNVILLVKYRSALQSFCKLPRLWPLTLTRPYTARPPPSPPGDVPPTVRPFTVRRWTNEEIDDLQRMDQNKVPMRTIAESLGRTVPSLRIQLRRIRPGMRLSTLPSRLSFSSRLWTADETDRAVQLKREGYSSSQIAKVLNRTAHSVRQKFHSMRQKVQRFSTGPFTSEEWEVLQKMKSEGAKYLTIARSLNRSPKTVRPWMYRQHYSKPLAAPYTATEDQKLRDLVAEATPWREIQRRMPQRTAVSLEKRYRQYLKPSASSFNRSPWKTDELDTLKVLATAGRGCSEIASRLNRSVPDVSYRINTELGNKRRVPAKWSLEELASLKSLRAEGKTYEVIAAEMGNRTAKACESANLRYLELGKRRRQRPKWSSEELASLKSLRAEGKTYEVVAAEMGNRTAGACAAADRRYLKQ